MRKYFLAMPVVIIALAVLAGISWQKTDTSVQTAAIEGNGKSATTAVPVASNPHFLPAGNGLVKVIRVIDGDTIEIESSVPSTVAQGREKVRYIGMNAPETVDPRKPVQCFGEEASRKNKELVEGKFVRLMKDVSERDKYGRLLRYVFLPGTGIGGDIFINLELVREGYAFSDTFPPDVKYQSEFVKAQAEARAAGRGLWSACPIKMK